MTCPGDKRWFPGFFLIFMLSFPLYMAYGGEPIDFENRNRTFEPLTQIKARPDMVILVPNGGIVFVYRDKYGSIIGEEYYSVRVQDQGVGLCDDLGNKDVWLFTGGGLLLHKEEQFPKGLQPYWRHEKKHQSFLHNEWSTLPEK
jgi:hypothetical protein